MSPRLVVAPEASFAELVRLFADSGWQFDSQAQVPIVTGEPEWAVFTFPSGARVHYTFNPVVSLRVFDFRGESDDAWKSMASRIPSLNLGRLRLLIQSGEKRSVLLGLFAATELEQMGVLDLAVQLCEHPDGRISGAALRLREVLILQGMNHTHRLLEEVHGTGEAFSLIPVLEWRRQVLRWIARDNLESNDSINQVLCAALSDADAEVRITAVLVTAKLKVRVLLDQLRRTVVPATTSEGAPPSHRLFYREIHRAAIRYLGEGAANDTFRSVLSGSLEVRDDPSLLLHSLLTPVELGAEPRLLPSGVESFDRAYRLRLSGLQLRWVAPVAHWLGCDHSTAVRHIAPAEGFFIAEEPLEEATAFDKAMLRCELLAIREGVSVAIPSADQWEMAARGPDGRTYPWGNSLVADWDCHRSPWGLQNIVGHGGEWARGTDGEVIVCGSDKPQPCATRELFSIEKHAKLRPVILI